MQKTRCNGMKNEDGIVQRGFKHVIKGLDKTFIFKLVKFVKLAIK